MKKFRSVDKLPLLALLFSPLLIGADLSNYRGFQFGMSLNAAVKHSGMDVSEVRTIHQRPARIEELTWNPGRFVSGGEGTDPVHQVVLTFYKGQLSRMVIDYDRDNTSGLTSDDMIQAISARYGASLRPLKDDSPGSASFEEGVSVVARWENADYSFDLVQSPSRSNFGLIAVSKRLDGLAQTAIASGIQIDEQEAPQRQLAEALSAQGKLAKARLENKSHFRP